MSILCATDFSDFAQKGATVAALLAHHRRVPLLLVHVTSARERSREALAAQAALKGEAERLTALGPSVKPLLRFGIAHKALLECIERECPTLIIAGAPAHDPPEQAIRGTLPRVAQAASAPMLAVRECAPFEAWLRGERPLLGGLLAPGRGRAHRRARLLARGGGQAARRLQPEEHAGELARAGEGARKGRTRPAPPPPRRRLPAHPACPGAGPRPSAQQGQALSRKLSSLAAPEAGDAPGRILPEVVSGEGSECILQAVERHDVDIVCLGSHGRTGLAKTVLGSVARTVLSRTRRPVLVIQAPS